MYNFYGYVDFPSKHLGKTLIQMFHKENLQELELVLWVLIQRKYIQNH